MRTDARAKRRKRLVDHARRVAGRLRLVALRAALARAEEEARRTRDPMLAEVVRDLLRDLRRAERRER